MSVPDFVCIGQVLISEGMLEAAARLGLFRSDFDSDLVDGLALCLRDRPEHHKCLCDWLLGVALSLLEPGSATEPTCRKHFRRLRRISSEHGTLTLRRVQSDYDANWVSAWGQPSPELAPAAPPSAIPPLQTSLPLPHQNSGAHPDSQEARFRFFAERVARLQLWRSSGISGVTLFDQLRIALQPLVDRLSAQCDARFAALDRSPAGSALRLFGSAFPSSQPEEHAGEKARPARAEQAQLVAEKVVEKVAIDKIDCACSLPIDSNQTLFIPGISFYDGTKLGGTSEEASSVKVSAALAMLLDPAASSQLERNSIIIDRQDHPRVTLNRDASNTIYKCFVFSFLYT